VRFPDRFKHFEVRTLDWAKRQFVLLDAGRGAEDGDPGIEIRLSDGSLYTHRGVIVAANRQIDSSTGTIQLQALVSNPDGVLRPGMFARVRIPRQQEGKGVLTVPDKALVSVQGTFSIAVVKSDDTVDLRRVDLGPSTEGARIVEHGAEEGERIIVEGLAYAKSGAKVTPRDAPPSAAGAGSAAPPGAPSAPR
jgi:membrane fusion protein (multidrug efflux system)